MQRLSDLEIYRELKALHERLEVMADAAMSMHSRTALRAAAKTIQKLASAFFKSAF
jgi:hypothetical protein